MLNKSDKALTGLRKLGLTTDEACLYVELLKEPSTHLKLAHATGINRTKVYRLASDLEKRSLVTKRTDDRGTFLVAADPATLEVELTTREEQLKSQRAVLRQLLPALEQVQTSEAVSFAVHTYEGTQGFKQMLWHELKSKGEALIFGYGEIESLTESVRWAEKHRAQTVEAGYTVREIINPGGKKEHFTKNDDFMSLFSKRYIDPSILALENQIVIYNDTVATYHWRNDQKVGFEVMNRAYADMARQQFEHYWQLAREA